MSADRLPPHNLEVEEGVLGAALLDNAALDDVLPRLRPEDFYRDLHQAAFRRMVAMRAAGAPVDSITLADEMIRCGDARGLGLPDDPTQASLELADQLIELALKVPHAANAGYHADIVRQKADARRLLEAAEETIREVYANRYTAEQLMARAEHRVLDVGGRRAGRRAVPLAEPLGRLLARIDRGPVPGVTGRLTGLDPVDTLLDGLQPGKVYVIAGRPAMGKSAYVQNVALHFALTYGEPVQFVSLEVPDEDVAMRLLSIHSGVPGRRMRNAGAQLTERDREAMTRCGGDLMGLPLFIHYAHDMTPAVVIAEARRRKASGGLGLVVVDYLQLLDPGADQKSRDNRQVEVARMSRSMKGLAMDLDVPVLVVSQLNRNAEDRTDKTPRMADLRESGALEADADVVILVHRPEYYDPDDQPGVCKLIVAKNRDGETGVTNALWDGRTFRLTDPADAPPEPVAAY